MNGRFDTRQVSRTTRSLIVAAAALAATLLAAPASASACPDAVVSQPFAAWNDARHYSLSPGGSFEDGATGWELGDGATLVAGGAPFVSDSAATALRLAPGSAATSAPFCVEPRDRIARLFARGEDASGARLQLELVDGDSSRASGLVQTGREWDATRPFAIPGPSHGERWLRYRFTAAGDDAVLIDDLYIDPHARH